MKNLLAGPTPSVDPPPSAVPRLVAPAEDASPVEVALHHWANGWHVLPGNPDPATETLGAKRALVRWKKLQYQRPTRDEILSWWEKRPDALVLAVTLGVTVVDVDVDNGGTESLFDLEDTYQSLDGPWPSAPWVDSPRAGGGWHRYFAGEVPARNPLLPGLDIKSGPASLIVLPGSMDYRGEWSLDVPTELPPVPSWLRAVCEQDADKKRPKTASPKPRRATNSTTDEGRVPPTRRGRRDGAFDREGNLTDEGRAEFRAIFESLDLTLDDGEHDYCCPWHDDSSPSLSVNTDQGVYCCHASTCGRSGGLKQLRDLSGLVAVSTRAPSPAKETGTNSLCANNAHARCPDAATVTLGRKKNPDVGRLALIDCKKKTCEVCGPRWIEKNLAHFGPLLTAQPIYRAVVPKNRWRAFCVRIKRAGAKYVRVPVDGATDAVLTTLETPDLVADPVAELADALAAQPADSGNLSESADWRRPVEPESEWKLLRTASVPFAQAVAIAKDMGLLIGDVDAADLDPDHVAAVVLDRRDKRLWKRFGRAIGGHQRSDFFNEARKHLPQPTRPAEVRT